MENANKPASKADMKKLEQPAKAQSAPSWPGTESKRVRGKRLGSLREDLIVR
jgi:hypothetical protein